MNVFPDEKYFRKPFRREKPPRRPRKNNLKISILVQLNRTLSREISRYGRMVRAGARRKKTDGKTAEWIREEKSRVS